MTWWTFSPTRGVLELDGPRDLELELHVLIQHGRTFAAWAWSQTGLVAWIAEVGEA